MISRSSVISISFLLTRQQSGLRALSQVRLIYSDSDQMILMVCQAGVIAKSVYDEGQEAKAIHLVCLPSGWAWTPQSH